MKLVKLTMLAATAALAASAFIGASSASATTHRWIALCDAQQLLLCEPSHLMKHPLLGRFLVLAGAGRFAAGIVNVECPEGMGESTEVQSQQLGEFNTSLESLSFTSCTGCSTVTVITPQAVVLNMESELTDTWRLKSTAAKVRFSGCPFGITCEYEGNLNLAVQMDAEGAYVDPENAKFNRIAGNGLCAATGVWETGRSRFDWKLDDGGLRHLHIWPTLLENLTAVNGVTL